MKIYHKFNFISGLISLVLGLILLLARITTNAGFDGKHVIILLFLLFFGGGVIIRSLSQTLTREDKLDELDERNQYINLKSKSKSLCLTQTICFVSMLLLFVLGKTSGYDPIIVSGIGMGAAFSISILTEIFTNRYYEKRL